MKEELEKRVAALLAHEINHVAGHHTILSHRITAKRLAIQVLGGALGSLMGQLRYSRQLEQEADDRAAVLLADTPYDATAMTELLEILREDFEGLDPRYDSVWTTHPDPDERVAASRANLAGLARQPRDVDGFDAVMYPLRSLTLRDYVQDDYPYTAIALAERFIARYPGDLDFRLILGDAWRVLGPRPEALPEDYDRRDARRNLRARILRTREQRMEVLLEEPEGVAALEFMADLINQGASPRETSAWTAQEAQNRFVEGNSIFLWHNHDLVTWLDDPDLASLAD